MPTIILALCSFAAAGLLQAQTAADEVTQSAPRGRLVPGAPPAGPFSTLSPPEKAAFNIEFRPADQMTEHDRLLLANAESSIAEHAGLNGLAFEQGNWSYDQIVCPALPNHLFLQYTRNNGTGDVSKFTASIPRNGNGRVRIIPILRRGYSLFSPAPISALTVSAFNHIRAEEPDKESSSWLGNGLCYAALAGAHPRIEFPDESLDQERPIPGVTATLEVPTNGGETIDFADAAARPRPMEWTMTFTRQGKLIKARHFPAPTIAAKPIPHGSPELKVRPVPQGNQE
ncbi:MAG TPA: hypothetical protein VMU48_22080 [Terracidiphilus sp.]|nr:hypothetical protein [Terracidiphilus sp.]